VKENIMFLKELQEELKTQDRDYQASPRFWTIGDYEMEACPEGCQDTYYVGVPEREYYGDLDEFLDEIKEDLEEPEDQEYPDDSKEEFAEIECEVSALDWIERYCDKDAYLIPVRERHIIHPNTMFITKQEAMEHLKANHYHYSPRAHTYAMTAWRAPKVERLLKMLETLDWDSI